MHYHNNGPQNGRTLRLTWIHYTVRRRSDAIVLSSDFVFFPLYLIVGASHVSLTCIQLVPCLFLILSLSLLFIRLPAQPVFTPASSYLLPLFLCVPVFSSSCVFERVRGYLGLQQVKLKLIFCLYILPMCPVFWSSSLCSSVPVCALKCWLLL